MTTTATQTEINEVREHFARGGNYANMNFQFVKKADGVMFSYDLNKGTYKFYNNEDKFYRAIVRFTKRGW